MRSLLKNKKGDFQSTIYTVVILFAIGVIILFFNHLFTNIYSEIDDKFSTNPRFNDTEAHRAIQDINDVESGGIWDYAFLGIAIGYIIILGVSSFSTRLNPVFFWIYVIVAIVGLVVAVMLSNTWQELAAAPEFAETIARFPITNTLLGTIYPTFVLGIIVIVLILTFGKFPGEQQ